MTRRNICTAYIIKCRPICNKRFLVKATFIVAIIALALVITVKISHAQRQYNVRQCFKRPTSYVEHSIAFFPDLSDAKKQPTPSETIFFLETSCSGDGFVRLNARQSCAVESAARANPDRDIFLLFASPRGLRNDMATPTPPFIEILQTYPNVHLRNINLWSFAEGTPAADWLDVGDLFRSYYLREHVSDLLRLLTLHKFGGTYLDLDTVVMKSLNDLPPNYAGAEDDKNICNAVLNFADDGLGHFVVDSLVREFVATYNHTVWSYNGPVLIRRMLQRLCRVELPADMTRERCQGFTVYPMETFYPFAWADWRKYFISSPETVAEALRVTNNSHVIHVWNDISHTYRVEVGAASAYGLIAEQKCPRSYRASGEYF